MVLYAEGQYSRWKRYNWSRRLSAVAVLGVDDTSERPLEEEETDCQEGSSGVDVGRYASL